MLQCYNRGCGQIFDPVKNNDDSCRHHPGAPFFHDAYKGWSCCNRKSVNFSEFLNIKGCTLSKHSNVKPPEPEKETNDVKETEQDQIVRAPIVKALDRPSISTSMEKVAPTVALALKMAVDELKMKDPASEIQSELNSGEIGVGTSCKNAGCTYSYTGTPVDDTECTFHPGVAIFHEGMKYWSCCKRKTSDFAVFMAQKGCAYGQHKWLKENDNKQMVQCRYDWHQTASNVIVSIYAKLYDYEKSSIEVNPIRLHVKLVFPNQGNVIFELDMELRGIIDVSKTVVNMYASKVEITLPKAESGLWSKLDFPRTELLPEKKAAVLPNVAQSKQEYSSESEGDFDLDDIETVSTGVRLSEICQESKSDPN